MYARVGLKEVESGPSRPPADPFESLPKLSVCVAASPGTGGALGGGSDNIHPAPAPAPNSRPAPALTSRPATKLTFDTFREQQEAQQLRDRLNRTAPSAEPAKRIHLVDRIKHPEEPARVRVRPKTVAFGRTVNVSQTVERKKEEQQEGSGPPAPLLRTLQPQQPQPQLPAKHHIQLPTPRASEPVMNANKSKPTLATNTAGTTETRPIGLGLPARPTTVPLNTTKENVEAKEQSEPLSLELVMKLLLDMQGRIASLETRLETRCGCVADESRCGRVAAETTKVAGQVRRLTEVVGKHEDQLIALKREQRRRSPPPVESVAQSLSIYEPPPPPRRQRSRSKPRNRGGATENGRGSGGRLDLSALERQMQTNPVLRQAVNDALAEDAYERYDDRSRSASPPPARGYRSGGNPPPTRTTPTRRRLTERVMVERVHHYDEDEEEDEERGEAVAGGAARNDAYDESQLSSHYPHGRRHQSAGRSDIFNPNKWNRPQRGPYIEEIEEEDEIAPVSSADGGRARGDRRVRNNGRR